MFNDISVVRLDAASLKNALLIANNEAGSTEEAAASVGIELTSEQVKAISGGGIATRPVG